MMTPEETGPQRKSTSPVVCKRRASIRANQHKEELPDSMKKVEALVSAVAVYYRPIKARRIYIASTP